MWQRGLTAPGVNEGFPYQWHLNVDLEDALALARQCTERLWGGKNHYSSSNEGCNVEIHRAESGRVHPEKRLVSRNMQHIAASVRFYLKSNGKPWRGLSQRVAWANVFLWEIKDSSHSLLHCPLRVPNSSLFESKLDLTNLLDQENLADVRFWDFQGQVMRSLSASPWPLGTLSLESWPTAWELNYCERAILGTPHAGDTRQWTEERDREVSLWLRTVSTSPQISLAPRREQISSLLAIHVIPAEVPASQSRVEMLYWAPPKSHDHEQSK